MSRIKQTLGYTKVKQRCIIYSDKRNSKELSRLAIECDNVLVQPFIYSLKEARQILKTGYLQKV